MTWSPMFLIRWLHKWFGLVLGLQFLLWSVSGAVMALLDHHKVAAEDAILPVAQLPAPAGIQPLARVVETAGGPVTRLQLKPLYDRWVYEATTASGVRLVDAASGALIPIDGSKARELAVARFSSQAPVVSVTHVAKPTLETRDMTLPAWRVQFADPDNTAVIVSAATGEVLGAKNDTWRLWDIAWMLHIMDYKERQSFNHPLIITLAFAAAWLALSGLILLFRSFRRSDVAWVLDPIEKMTEKRKTARVEAG
ncbi:PepSY domain-containing protein [Phenylobacterium sp. J367]|uniref:PepSY domain-containing protein n=1 Tax=Phenylobacterium sp. J367 TaxID=2898435 RepID=UPI002151DFA1|nr:PepSY domain-containing protein [Phenylobacterium sp. J367]MCR5879308.1 PepSY domain-containing protein [Phenylobacterium sp. J367]